MKLEGLRAPPSHLETTLLDAALPNGRMSTIVGGGAASAETRFLRHIALPTLRNRRGAG